MVIYLELFYHYMYSINLNYINAVELLLGININ